MRHLVAIMISGTVLLGAAAQAAPAMPVYSHQRAHLFAKCAGRLAALALHQSSKQHEAAPESRRLKEEFDMLLGAVLPDAMDQGVPDGQAELWRAQGWSEIAGFLAEQSYSFDARIADLARIAAAERIDECRDLVLPPAT